MAEWFEDIEKELQEIEAKNSIRDPFQAWNNLVGRQWKGIHLAAYRLRHSFPRVGLIEHSGVPLFRLTADIRRHDLPGVGSPCKTVAYCGHGVTFRSALCDLLTKIEAQAETATVWAPYPPDQINGSRLWSELNAHPLFGKHSSECLKLQFGLETGLLNPKPVYLLDAGPWRNGAAAVDPYLHSSAANLPAALYCLTDRIRRAYGNVCSLPDPDAIRHAWLALQEHLDRFDFSFTKDGLVCAKLKQSREAPEDRLACPMVGSYEDVLLQLEEAVKGVCFCA